jgi:hypothetical protein
MYDTYKFEPNPRCKDCYGRGTIVRIVGDRRLPEECYCIREKKLPLDHKKMTTIIAGGK